MRPLHQYTDGGLRNVWLVNGYELKQTPFGEGVVIHDLDGLTKAVCLALTDKPGRVPRWADKLVLAA